MTAQQFDIPWARPHFWGNEKDYVGQALESSWISGGPFIDRFEESFAALCGVDTASSCANGTAALHLVYLALGIAPCDEIVVPAFGFLAAANIALHFGAKPVFCDVSPDSWCMRAEDIARVLSPRTRAVVAVHTYGNVCELQPILELCNSRSVPLIEDAAEAFPARYRGRMAGTLGLAGTYSFQATKTITCGEGGMIVVKDEKLLERIALYKSHGLRRKRHYWHELPGHNFRLTNLQAALGLAQLEQVGAIVKERHRVYEAYRARLSGLRGIKLQVLTPDTEPTMWALGVQLDAVAYPQGRDRVIEQMAERGIETRPGFYPPSALDYFGSGPLPVSDHLAATIVCPPCFPTLTAQQIDTVCAALADLQCAAR